jgi:uncharacterized protein
MTPQEEAMLNDLVGRVEQTQLTEKDPEAEQLLLQRLGRNPNALYILAQTVLVQKYALEQATSQINQLRQQAQAPPQPAHTTSFLGSLLGHRDPAPPPPPPPAPPPPGYGAAPAQPYAQPWAPVPSYGAPPPPPPGGGSSFLRTAATTAAGVAAGALAFQGVESLMHGFGGGSPAGLGGGGFFGGGGEGRPEETVINNYYDDPGRGEGSHVDNSSFGDNDATNLQQASDDLRDDGDDQDDLSLDDSSYDDSSFDDDSSGGDDLA